MYRCSVRARPQRRFSVLRAPCHHWNDTLFLLKMSLRRSGAQPALGRPTRRPLARGRCSVCALAVAFALLASADAALDAAPPLPLSPPQGCFNTLNGVQIAGNAFVSANGRINITGCFNVVGSAAWPVTSAVVQGNGNLVSGFGPNANNDAVYGDNNTLSSGNSNKVYGNRNHLNGSRATSEPHSVRTPSVPCHSRSHAWLLFCRT